MYKIEVVISGKKLIIRLPIELEGRKMSIVNICLSEMFKTTDLRTIVRNSLNRSGVGVAKMKKDACTGILSKEIDYIREDSEKFISCLFKSNFSEFNVNQPDIKILHDVVCDFTDLREGSDLKDTRYKDFSELLFSSEEKPSENKDKEMQDNSDIGVQIGLAISNIIEKQKAEAKIDPEAVKKIVNDIAKDTVESIMKDMIKPKVIQIPEFEPVDITQSHYMTETLIKLVQLRKQIPVNIMLVGPAGSGKTHTVQLVSETLKMGFYPMSVGPHTSKTDLMGYCDANGNYHPSVIRKAFENGGVLLLDELDAANAGVITALNSLLENGYCSFPDKVVKKHPDFVSFCCCNTYGRGANRQYIGRNSLDAATLDRFIVIDFDYDESLEKVLTGDDSWHSKIKKYRDNAERLKLKAVVSPRASMRGAVLLKAGFDKDFVKTVTVFKGLPEDQIEKLKQGVS